MKRLAAAIVAIAVLIALIACFVKHITTVPETTTTATSSSTHSDDNVVGKVISSVIAEQNFSDDQLSHMNLVYNPYTMEVGDSLIVFPQYAKENGFCTLYLAGVNDPESIKVEGWFLIEKTVVDTGLIKLLVCNQVVDNTAVSDGQITYDGSRTVYIR